MDGTQQWSTNWQCANCRNWIPFGQSHNCGGYTWPAAVQSPEAAAIHRVATALERIAAALEAKP